MRRIFTTAAVVLVSLSIACAVSAGADAVLYRQAREHARKENYDFAYMKLRSLLRSFPESRHAADAQFALGEYYMLIPINKKAKKEFKRYLGKYKEDVGALFALSYLYKIASDSHNNQRAEEIKKQIIEFQRVGFLFSEKEKLVYRSPLQRTLTAVIEIDQIKFKANEETYLEINY